MDGFVITFLIFIGIFLVIWISSFLVPSNNEELRKFEEEYDAFFLSEKVVSLHTRNGYDIFEISGLQHYLSIYNVGRFNGYAIAETNNIFDEYAVSIYEENGKLLGYVPRKDNKKIHKYILSKGGKVHCYGFVKSYPSGYLYGNVCVESDEKLVVRSKNKYVPSSCKINL